MPETGQLNLNAQGDRRTDEVVDKLYNIVNGTLVYVHKYVRTNQTFESFAPVVWPGGTSIAPQGFDIYFGLLIPSTTNPIFNIIAAAAVIAVKEINDNKTIAGGLRLGYIFGEDTKCSSKGGLNSVSQLLEEHASLNGLIGPVS